MHFLRLTEREWQKSHDPPFDAAPPGELSGAVGEWNVFGTSSDSFFLTGGFEVLLCGLCFVFLGEAFCLQTNWCCCQWLVSHFLSQYKALPHPVHFLRLTEWEWQKSHDLPLGVPSSWLVWHYFFSLSLSSHQSYSDKEKLERGARLQDRLWNWSILVTKMNNTA